jgi:hypothetical protein
MSQHAKAAVPAAVLAACLALGLTPLAAGASTSADVPVYPGAVAAARPAGVGLKKAPPAQAKTYVTSDGFAKVKAWYQAHLRSAQEMQQGGMEKFEDAFLVGSVDSGKVVMVESYQGKTWIVIGPPV